VSPGKLDGYMVRPWGGAITNGLVAHQL
jgi:hypothetical protein